MERILTNKDRNVQILIAGKAHPQDEEGKSAIRDILRIIDEEPFRQHIVFLQNYDMNIARYLVQGVDLWLNNPRRGLEASGTSGMKAAANGAINFSTLDGWWDEIYKPGIGWLIGRGEVYEDTEYWDRHESNALYEILEKEIVPAFYNRDSSGLPREWISMMKRSMIEICPVYNTNRMVYEYTYHMYQPSMNRLVSLCDNDFENCRNLAAWKDKLRENWKNVRILKVESEDTNYLSVDTPLNVRAEILLGSLSPDDVSVEIYYGKIGEEGHIPDGTPVAMDLVDTKTDKYIFSGKISNWNSGLNGYTIRVIPRHDSLGNPYEDALIRWY